MQCYLSFTHSIIHMPTPEIIAHLSKDKKFSHLPKKIKLSVPKARTDLYFHLMRAIAGQQLSVKAAATIWDRVIQLFPDQYPHAHQMLSMDKEKLRAAGLSYQKVGYMKNIAQFSIDQTLDYKKLRKKSDDELIEYLTQIKGVGRWTVEMILMFSLVRPDILPVDDLGIQNAMKHLYKLTSSGKELKTEMMSYSKRWQPYRTYACMYLWRYKDNLPMAKKP